MTPIWSGGIFLAVHPKRGHLFYVIWHRKWIMAIMADIISLNDRQNLKEREQSEIIRRQKFSIFQKTLQCSKCPSRCEKCGVQIDMAHARTDEYTLRVPYRFCESCSSEYMDYIDRLKGKADPAGNWQNEDWMDIWKRWIDYQGAVDRYLKSKEYRLMVQEQSTHDPNE